MKKIKIKIPNWAIIIATLVLAVGLTSTFVRASGRFNLPLSWILTPSGTSIDTDNDGLIDFDRLPSGMITMFDTDCPSSWTRLTALDGKFLVGGASYNSAAGGSDNITLATANLPSHTHSVDPPSTVSNSQSASHTHGMTHTHAVDPPSTASGSQSASHTHGMTHTHSIDPPSTGSSSNGNHTHSQGTFADGGTGNSLRVYVDWDAYNNRKIILAAGAHTHTTNIAAFTSGGSSSGSTGSQSVSHTHTTNIGSFTSGGSSAGSTGSQSAGHTHTTDISSFTSGATGSGTSFDNRPAYATIVICKKD